MRYYIATSLENHRAHNRVREALDAQGHEITYDWTVHGPVWRDGLDRIREVSVAEMKGVTEADVVVVLLPGGRGTHTELGMALAVGKPVVLVGNADVDFAAVAGTCAFYHHPRIIKVSRLDEDDTLLTDPDIGNICKEVKAIAWKPAVEAITITGMVQEAHSNSFDHGFWDDQRDEGALVAGAVLKTVPEKLCLVHSEASEALECYREGSLPTVLSAKGKPEGFGSELADILIRVADLAGAMGIDLEHEVRIKMAYNRSRPYKHGKVC